MLGGNGAPLQEGTSCLRTWSAWCATRDTAVISDAVARAVLALRIAQLDRTHRGNTANTKPQLPVHEGRVW